MTMPHLLPETMPLGSICGLVFIDQTEIFQVLCKRLLRNDRGSGLVTTFTALHWSSVLVTLGILCCGLHREVSGYSIGDIDGPVTLRL